jgi:hypothetical protein
MRQRHSSLQLDVFSSMTVYGWASDADQKAFGDLYRSATQPGVTLHGSVPQPVLLQNLAHSGFLLYPNTYPETSCIAAIEAQAAGCVVVTSALAALKETVENGTTGICINGDPHSDEYQKEFVAAVHGLLKNPSRLMTMSEAARKRAWRIYDWAVIAAEWNDILARMPAQNVHQRWSGPLILLQKSHDYLQNGNVSAASRVLTRLEETPFLRKEVEALKGKINTWM